MDTFKDYIGKLQQRLGFIQQLYAEKHISITCDSLEKQGSVDHELLYITLSDNKEYSGIFVFGSQFFICDISEQEFKSKLSLNSLNFKILRAYKRLKKRQETVKVSDILQEIQDKKKDSNELDVILRRILTLAYYLNWDLKKDKKDIEGDSIITIPDIFMQQLKQRFSFHIMCSIYEDEDVFMFLNSRGKLNVVFKDKEQFTKTDLHSLLPKIMNQVFSIEECNLM